MPNPPRDVWDWIDLSVRVLAGIAIPGVLFWYGHELRKERQEARNADRVRRSIEHLTSSNWRERLMGVQVMWHHCAKDKYPSRLVAVLASTVRTDSNRKVLRAANKLFSEIGDNSTASASGVSQCDADLPNRFMPEIQRIKDEVRFYLHVRETMDRSVAATVRDSVDGDTILVEDDGSYVINVLGIEELEQGPSSTQLRFFHSGRKALADSLSERVQAISDDAVSLNDLSSTEYGGSNHLELWIAPQ